MTPTEARAFAEIFHHAAVDLAHTGGENSHARVLYIVAENFTRYAERTEAEIARKKTARKITLTGGHDPTDRSIRDETLEPTP